jgi:MoaA/NifB/PqqE/SkfB family radical SAM enzyme
MARIVIELTNRCHLRCRHCFSGRHGGNDDLAMDTLHKILVSAKPLGFNEIAFTGGEPILHPGFREILIQTAESGYRFGFVSNGWHFPEAHQDIPAGLDRFQGITFSMDGAGAASHDELRGKGSHRSLMSAFSICMAKDIPFTINSLLTTLNQYEIESMVDSASALGSRGIRFGHFISSNRKASIGLALSPEERCAAEDRIYGLQATAPIPVILAPGFRTPKLFPCASLQADEINIDYNGNVSLCCLLSNHTRISLNSAVVGSLNDFSFNEAFSRIRKLVHTFKAEKTWRHSQEEFSEEDYLPCHYCKSYFLR